MAGPAASSVRTVFIGTSDFAAAVLLRLGSSAYRPVLVVTRPDRPQGRGRRLQPPPVLAAAVALGLQALQPSSVNDPDVFSEIRSRRPQALVVCAFGEIIREPLLSLVPVLNVHPSLLPRWRGAAPIERALLAGDELTGVSIMRLTGGLDSGPVCLVEAVAITAEDDYGSLAARLEQVGAALLVRALEEQPPCTEQPEQGISYAAKLAAAERRIDPATPAEQIARQVRALSPHIGAWVELDEVGRMTLWRVRPLAGGVAASQKPGTVVSEGRRPVLVCGSGALELLEVQPAGRRRMDGSSWLYGRAKADSAGAR
ncbi:MAG: methionyl-tRNA formyltransferase [Solirubrobacteraceae bacterium]